MASTFTITQQGVVGTYDLSFAFTFENENDFVNTTMTYYSPTISSDKRTLTCTLPYDDATPYITMGTYISNFGTAGNSFTCLITSPYVQHVTIDNIQNCEASNRNNLITIKNLQDNFYVSGTFDVVMPGVSVGTITATFGIDFW